MFYMATVLLYCYQSVVHCFDCQQHYLPIKFINFGKGIGALGQKKTHRA